MIAGIENALVVGDDALMRECVVETLRRSKIAATEVSNGLEAKELLKEGAFDLAFIDLKTPGLDGLQLLDYMRAVRPAALSIAIAAFGSIEKALEAMRMGAHDFLMKPFSPEQVDCVIKRARDWSALRLKNAYLLEELGWHAPTGCLFVGKTETAKALMGKVELAAKSLGPVLIEGEVGTRMDLVALAIHALGERRSHPFVRMNCALVPEPLVLAELFGQERSVFNKNDASCRPGRLDLAGGGTLLLEEIGGINLSVQAKLLKFLQENEFERVGSREKFSGDCRVIATTSRHLKQMVAEGTFRQDLYFRLRATTIWAPSLRERLDDVPLMVEAMASRYSQFRSNGQAGCQFAPETLSLLQQYNWPGNVRELEHLVEHLCVLCERDMVTPEMLPIEIRKGKDGVGAVAGRTRHRSSETHGIVSIPEMERQAIVKTLRALGGNRTRSAEFLQISIRTLRNKLNEYRQRQLLPADLL